MKISRYSASGPGAGRGTRRAAVGARPAPARRRRRRGARRRPRSRPSSSGRLRGVGEHEGAVGVADVAGQLVAPAGRVDADDDGAGQRGGAEQEHELRARSRAARPRGGRLTPELLEQRGAGGTTRPRPRPSVHVRSSATRPGWSSSARAAKSSPTESATREAEHALGDDVALDLRRARPRSCWRSSGSTARARCPAARRWRGARRGRSSRPRARRRPGSRPPPGPARWRASLAYTFIRACSGRAAAGGQLGEAAVAEAAGGLRCRWPPARSGRRPAPARSAASRSSSAGASSRSRSSDSSRPITAPTQTMPRSWASEPLAIAQPSFSVPTRLAAGTRTSSRNTSLRSGWSGWTISGSGRTVMPGVSIGTSRMLMPLCLGASGSVRQNRKQKSA